MTKKVLSKEHLEIIQKVARKLATSFSYYEKEDVEQEVVIFCMELMPKWDKDRPLENFLTVAARTRLYTLIREKYYRTSDPEHLASAKKNAQNFVELFDLFEDDFCFRLDSIEELDNVLDSLPPQVRADFLRLAQGVKVPTTRRQKVFELVKEYGENRENV
jgi:DNA-directed RNA polymerase specialized sigma24 family protein